MWYSQGTITATINNTVINGTGTAFIQGVRVGDGITIAGSTSLHEVISIASNTQMTIKPAYTGATGSGKQYAVAPILGYDKDLSDAFNQLRLQFGDKLSSLQPWAHAATASAALDALGFSVSGKAVATGTAAQGREGLGLKSAATRDATVGNADVAEGRLLKVGDLGSNKHPTLVFDFNVLPEMYPYSGLIPSMSNVGSTNGPTKGVYHHVFQTVHVAGNVTQIAIPYRDTDGFSLRNRFGGVWGEWRELYHTGNTTKNPDGTLKASSPVINLYANHHDLHNEEQFGATPTVTRKSKGVYEITGTLGMRSEGWYLDTPNDRNGNKYFNVEWTQNITPTAVDGIVDEYRDDIAVTIETFERAWNKETGMFDNGAPIDINELQDRFVQLRFNEIKVEHEELDDETITQHE